MVMNTVHATYTETYDLNTAINEISLLGVHTPMARALKSQFKGFYEQYRKYKIVGCNIAMVCASQQSLTPSEVGLEAGQVDPRDILNPILFKACTGENLNEILNQIYASGTALQNTSSLIQHIDNSSQAQNMYYQLLADDTWRKEHPQRGLFVKGLKPLVHKIVTTQPLRWTGYMDAAIRNSSSAPGSDGNVFGFGSPSGTPVAGVTPNVSNDTVFVSDGTVDMPWLDTTYDGTVSYTPAGGSETLVKSQRLIVSVPRVFCGCIILPPAILQRLFFRLQISWHIMFKDFRPAFEVGALVDANLPTEKYNDPVFTGQALGSSQSENPTYWNIYHDATTKLDKEFSSFDVNGQAEVTQVMEQVS